MADYSDALARAREAKRVRDAKLAAEVAELTDLPELIIDGEYQGFEYTGDDIEEAFSNIFRAPSLPELADPKPIVPVTVIPAKVPKDYSAVYGSILRETEKAALFSVRQPTPDNPEHNVQWWIPLSQVCYIQRSRHGLPYRDLIHVKQWVLDNHGFEHNQFTK